MKKKIIISGICGFLGNRLKELLTEEFQVLGIDIKESINGNIKVFSSTDLADITTQPDYIVLCHAAVSSGTHSESIDLLFSVNVKLTEEIINKFPNAKIIYISTASIYRTNGHSVEEDTIDDPINNYSMSKYWAEKLVSKSRRASIIRISSLFGINMKENTIIPNYVNQALNNNKIDVWGGGKRIQNYIHVDDVCLLIKKIIYNHEKIDGKILLAVSNKEYSNLELAKLIAEFTKAKIEFVNKDESLSVKYNNKKTRNLMSWSETKDFSSEIKKYILWKQEQY
jgi:nucleoside-diphosphate-sugar epimerase